MLTSAVAVIPSVARADAHDDWELLLGSIPNGREGTCEADLVLIGSGFEGLSEVAVGRLDGTTFVELQRVAPAMNGLFRIDGFDLGTTPCVVGDIITVAVRAAGDVGQGAAPSQVTVEYRPIEKPGSITLDPPWGPGCEAGSITIAGSGFPPNVQMMIAIGGANALAHEVAEIDRAQTDASGSFTAAPALFPGAQCEADGQFAIHAFVFDPPKDFDPDFPRASAIYTVASVAPASAGSAGLGVATRAPSEAWTLFLFVATTALVVLARATVRRSHR